MKRNNITKVLNCFMLLLFSCNLYENNDRLLSSYTTSKGDKISIYFVDMGATTKEVIQVRSSKDLRNNGVIANFPKNYLQESKLINDTVLYVVLTDSGSIKKDTEWVKLNETSNK